MLNSITPKKIKPSYYSSELFYVKNFYAQQVLIIERFFSLVYQIHTKQIH